MLIERARGLPLRLFACATLAELTPQLPTLKLSALALVDPFALALSADSFAIILLSGAFLSLTLYTMSRFNEMRSYSIGKRLLETAVGHPRTCNE